MKESKITVAALVIVASLLIAYLITFQVRIDEVAIHYRPRGTVLRVINKGADEAGLYWRLPWPFDKVVKYDKRVRVLDGKVVETQLKDLWQITISMYAAWQIDDPGVFVRALKGDEELAEQVLKDIILSETSNRIGRAGFGDLVSMDREKLQYAQIERDIITGVRDRVARRKYGLKVVAFGIRQLGVPSSVTKPVFDRMRAERETEAAKFIEQGKSQKRVIISTASKAASDIIARAEAEATGIRAAAEQKEAEYYREFAKAPELAIFLNKVKSLRTIARQARQSGTPLTLIVDTNTAPFDLLSGAAGNDYEAEGKPDDLVAGSKGKGD